MSSFFFVSIAHASTASQAAQCFLDKINQAVLYPLIILLMSAALLMFLYGAFKYVLSGSEITNREEGRKHMLWGLVGLFVMVSAYAILAVAANTIPGISIPEERCAASTPTTPSLGLPISDTTPS